MGLMKGAKPDGSEGIVQLDSTGVVLPLIATKTDVAVSQTDSAVSGGDPAKLFGVYATSASGTVIIKDGITTEYTIVITAIGKLDLANADIPIAFATDINVTTDANAAVKLYWKAD